MLTDLLNFLNEFRELYGSGVERLRIEHQTFETPSNRKLEVVTIASNYHIEVIIKIIVSEIFNANYVFYGLLG